jgi:tRNA nucleotidyltransferase/poly(A) polymerase
VPLDEERDIARVVFKGEGDVSSLQVDVVPLGETIAENLAQRDFTINAMAMSLGQGVNEATLHEPIDSLTHLLIDPFGGLSDLRGRRIRVVRPEAFTDDPLRLLRAVRFAARLGFEMEAETWQAVCQHAPLLDRVAAERVRDEFFAILQARPCVPYLRLLRDAGLLGVVLPEMSDPVDVARGLQAVASVEQLIAEIGSARARETLLKFAALLCPVLPQPATIESVAQKMKLSNEERRVLSLIALHHDKPRSMVAENTTSGKYRRRFFRAVGNVAVEVLLMAMAIQDEPDAALSVFVNDLLHDYFADAPSAHPTRFVRGDEIMARYHLPPSPRIRELLEAIEEAEAEGQVRNREDAWQLLDGIAASTG